MTRKDRTVTGFKIIGIFEMILGLAFVLFGTFLVAAGWLYLGMLCYIAGHIHLVIGILLFLIKKEERHKRAIK